MLNSDWNISIQRNQDVIKVNIWHKIRVAAVRLRHSHPLNYFLFVFTYWTNIYEYSDFNQIIFDITSWINATLFPSVWKCHLVVNNIFVNWFKYIGYYCKAQWHDLWLSILRVYAFGCLNFVPDKKNMFWKSKFENWTFRKSIENSFRMTRGHS